MDIYLYPIIAGYWMPMRFWALCRGVEFLHTNNWEDFLFTDHGGVARLKQDKAVLSCQKGGADREGLCGGTRQPGSRERLPVGRTNADLPDRDLITYCMEFRAADTAAASLLLQPSFIIYQP
ncbi:unnamed protein product [Pleuronectes platessa]|uniref:Uncharacterized protein n=1 Tax=Pleuronectes platessa TaxID=8262 RepID=A0A9N7TKB6_PLEPL|nr:unnamed protein product [Pleuronectes platessa]